MLGPVTIGAHSRIGAGSVVVTSVPPDSTVVGIPGKVVRTGGLSTPRAASPSRPRLGDLPDPVSRALGAVLEQVERLEKKVAELSSRSEPQAAPRAAELRRAAGDDE